MAKFGQIWSHLIIYYSGDETNRNPGEDGPSIPAGRRRDGEASAEAECVVGKSQSGKSRIWITSTTSVTR